MNHYSSSTTCRRLLWVSGLRPILVGHGSIWTSMGVYITVYQISASSQLAYTYLYFFCYNLVLQGQHCQPFDSWGGMPLRGSYSQRSVPFHFLFIRKKKVNQWATEDGKIYVFASVFLMFSTFMLSGSEFNPQCLFDKMTTVCFYLNRALACGGLVNPGKIWQLWRLCVDLPTRLRGIPHCTEVNRPWLHVFSWGGSQRRSTATCVLGEFHARRWPTFTILCFCHLTIYCRYGNAMQMRCKKCTNERNSSVWLRNANFDLFVAPYFALLRVFWHFSLAFENELF